MRRSIPQSASDRNTSAKFIQTTSGPSFQRDKQNGKKSFVFASLAFPTLGPKKIPGTLVVQA